MGSSNNVKEINEIMDSVKLSKLSFDKLEAMRKKIEREGAITDKNSFYRYDKKSRIKLDAIAWAVTYKLQEKRRTGIPLK